MLSAFFTFSCVIDLDYLQAFYMLKIIGANTALTSLANVASIGNYGNSGWQSFSMLMANPVNGNISFSVSNALDNALPSTLNIANVAIPEPGMLLLMATALGLVGVASRRKSKAAV